ncbi:transcriptional regulator [Pseudomonas sp. PS02288]|uniref:transcriptional regulator n=1 Tax=Pseudomonas sp. PS02288 TaxID=2991443 RepID=UPI00249C6A54|nr:transcriptional regulator [Pseudomonas sp. PS02288]
MRYNWDLIERLLLEVQDSSGKNFAPRVYAEELAGEKANQGEAVGNVDSLKKEAGDLEGVLLKGGFIEPRPEEAGGNGVNFILTERGMRLLDLLDSDGPDPQGARNQLDAKGEAALVPEVFDSLAA